MVLGGQGIGVELRREPSDRHVTGSSASSAHKDLRIPTVMERPSKWEKTLILYMEK